MEGFGFVNAHVCNLCNIFFGRLGTWFLTGPSLVAFCCNRNIVGRTGKRVGIYIGLYGVTPEQLRVRCERYSFIIAEESGDCIIGAAFNETFIICLYNDGRKGTIRNEYLNHTFPKERLQCADDLCEEYRQKSRFMSGGMWKVPLSETEALEFRLPYMVGAVLDAWNARWWDGVEYDPKIWRFNDVYFNPQRCANAVELIGQMYACGKAAGIDHAMFLGYGTLLGAIRQGGFIPSDRDMDMCIISDWITVDQANVYVDACKAAGLGEHRWVTPQRRSDTGMPLWFSLGPKNPVSDNGIKSCNWFWFSHGGYWWHSKGGMWVSPTKFSKKKTQYNNSDAAIAKGVPATCLTKLTEAVFKGIPVRYPNNVGECLDHFYPCWPVPREGASAHEWVMVVEKWEDKNTWRVG